MANNRTHDRFDDLSQNDVVATLRSLERRFGSVQSQATSPHLEEVIDRPGPSGVSLDSLVSNAARGASLVAASLDTSLDAVNPVVAAPTLDPSERAFTDEQSWSIQAAVNVIADEANRAADRVDHASSNALSRDVSVTGSAPTTPLAIGQQLARELIAALTTSERHVEWLEGEA